MSDLVTKTADALPVTSRNFYENATFKLFLSMVWSAIGIFFLGLCAACKCLINLVTLGHSFLTHSLFFLWVIDGGQSQSAGYLKGTGYDSEFTRGNTDDKGNTTEQDGFGE